MDFGLVHGRASATAQSLTAASGLEDMAARPDIPALALDLTQHRGVLGTPAYMAPEQ